MGAPRGGLSGRPQSRTTRGGGDSGRARAGFGRRRNRKNPCAYNTHSAHFQSGPRAAGGNSRGHLHQQGGARDEAARRPDGRPNCRGNAVAWHVPLDRRENFAAPRGNGRFEVEFHDSRRRRPDPRDQTAPRSREARREKMACSGVRHVARRLEKPRADARPGAGRGSRQLRQRQGQEALPRLSGAAEDAQRRRLRRSSARKHPAVPAHLRTFCGSISSASSTSWWTNIRTPTWRSICGCGCWRSPLRHSGSREAAVRNPCSRCRR